MHEHRTEQRLMCSDLVTVQLENQDAMLIANLEDISPSGACFGMEQEVAKDSTITLHCSDCRFRGQVRYCVLNDSGYQVGVQWMECKWSKQMFEPRHLLEPQAPKRRPCCDESSCPRADISRLMEPESPISDRVPVVARAVAWTCEELSGEQLRQCFSRWFQLPPECSLCDDFVRSYQAEYAYLCSQRTHEKRMAAGAHSDDV